MEAITAYKTIQGRIFETEQEARSHEFVMLLKYVSGALPSRRIESFEHALETMGREIASGIYKDAAKRLLTAADYFKEHERIIISGVHGTAEK